MKSKMSDAHILCSKKGSNTSEIIKAPTPTDVLCGRGAPITKHTGNRVFRKVVKFNKELHNVCTREERFHLAESIVRTLQDQSPPTRFLEACAGSAYSKEWIPISKERAIRKTLQALREKESDEDNDLPPDSLIKVLSGESISKKTYKFGQNSHDGWNKVFSHLIPKPIYSSWHCESENSSPKKKQKLHVSRNIIPEGNNQNVAIGLSENTSLSKISPPSVVSSSATYLIDKRQEASKMTSKTLNGMEEFPYASSQELNSSVNNSAFAVEDSFEKADLDFDMYMALEDLSEELEREEVDIHLNIDVNNVFTRDQSQENMRGIKTDWIDDSYDDRSLEYGACFNSFWCCSASESTDIGTAKAKDEDEMII